MSDIVENLNRITSEYPGIVVLCRNAAAEITRLRAELAKLESVRGRPFNGDIAALQTRAETEWPLSIAETSELAQWLDERDARADAAEERAGRLELLLATAPIPATYYGASGLDKNRLCDNYVRWEEKLRSAIDAAGKMGGGG